jgi:uncharacterized protein (TIGR02001 family)
MYRGMYVAVTCVLGIVPLTAGAQKPDPAIGQLLGSVVFTSDYVDRGISQSAGHAAVQGQLGWLDTSGLFAALWGSSVDFDDGGEATMETNYIVGFERSAGRFTAGVDLTYVDYPGAGNAVDYDLVEIGGHVQCALGRHAISARVVLAPDNSGGAGQAFYAELGLSRKLSEYVSLGAHIGRQWNEIETIAGPDYHDWALEVNFAYEPVDIVLAYTDTDAGAACNGLCDARVVVSFRADL